VLPAEAGAPTGRSDRPYGMQPNLLDLADFIAPPASCWPAAAASPAPGFIVLTEPASLHRSGAPGAGQEFFMRSRVSTAASLQRLHAAEHAGEATGHCLETNGPGDRARRSMRLKALARSADVELERLSWIAFLQRRSASVAL